MVQWLTVETRAGSHFRFCCGLPFILARSLRNGTRNTGGPLCVCTPHMQSITPPLPLCKEQPTSAGMGIGLCLSTMCASSCTLERTTLPALKKKNRGTIVSQACIYGIFRKKYGLSLDHQFLEDYIYVNETNMAMTDLFLADSIYHLHYLASDMESLPVWLTQ